MSERVNKQILHCLLSLAFQLDQYQRPQASWYLYSRMASLLSHTESVPFAVYHDL